MSFRACESRSVMMRLDWLSHVASRQDIDSPRRRGESLDACGICKRLITTCPLSPENPTMPKKQSSSSLSTLAKVLSGEKKPTTADAKKVAVSVLSQDEKKGQRK